MTPMSRVSGRALRELLPDVRQLPGPVYLAVADSVTALVLDGRIATHTRLPSERELAGALRLSRATVTSAYDALRTEGFLTSRTGSGSFVTVPTDARPGRTRWQTGQYGGDVIDLSCAALPAPAGLLPDAIAAATAKLAPLACGDGYSPAGLLRLREAIAVRFTARGVPTTADQVLVTNGALHAIDLLLRLLVGPGDRLLTELPAYPGVLDAARANSARVVPVPMAPGGGWQVDQLQATLRQAAPRAAFLVPDFHNPTGALMDEQTRRDVLRAARRTGTAVIVDESFVDLGFCSPQPAAAAIDDSVITVGSLSKPVWGGLRIGWVRASAELVHRLAALRASIDMGGAVLDQLVATEVLPHLDAIAAGRITMLVPQRDSLLRALHERLPQWRPTVPAGGLSVWLELDAPLSTPLSLMAAPAGVMIVPGSRFGVDGTLERFLRLPFSLPAERLAVAVDRLAGVWERLDRPASSPRTLVVA